MMARPGGHSASWTGHWVRGSWIYRWATGPPRPEAPLLKRCALLHVTRSLSCALPVLAGVGALSTLACVVAGQFAIARLGGAFVFSLFFPRVALLMVPALFIWGPRLNLAVSGDESLFLRLDLAAVGGMLAACVFHRRGSLRSPPGHGVFVVFLGVLAVSVLLGLVRGTLTTPVSSVLYLGQWLELYAVYVLAYSLAARDSDSFFPPLTNTVLVYTWALPLLALAAYGLAEARWPYYEEPGVRYRTFERILFPGQANHAAGLFAFATATGLALATTRRFRILGIALALLCTLAIAPTGSRSGVLAWLAGVGGLALIAAPPLRWWGAPACVVALVAIPSAWWQRFAAPGSSMYDRLVAWKSAVSTVDAYPLLGLGAGARHRSYYDNHYLMTLSESGLLGMALLLVLLAVLARALAFGAARWTWWRIGALAGLAALAVHALATATFIVTMVAGPFFWFCGVAMARRDPWP